MVEQQWDVWAINTGLKKNKLSHKPKCLYIVELITLPALILISRDKIASKMATNLGLHSFSWRINATAAVKW